MNHYKAITEYLQSQSIGTEGIDIFLSHAPQSPDNLIALFPTSGIYDVNNIVHPYNKGTFQILVRNIRSDVADTKIQAIYNVLQGLSGVELSTIYFVEIIALQDTYTDIGKDSLNRYQFVQNYRYEIYNPTLYRQ